MANTEVIEKESKEALYKVMKYLDSRRVLLDMSKTELSKRAGLSSDGLFNALGGKTDVSFTTYWKISKALDMNLIMTEKKDAFKK